MKLKLFEHCQTIEEVEKAVSKMLDAGARHITITIQSQGAYGWYVDVVMIDDA